MDLITIENKGQDIASTNYWDCENSRAGFLFLSLNAGAVRLLVPPAAESMLPEMKTAKRITIEPSISLAGCLDIVFEDGSDSPFSVSIDKKQMDHLPPRGSGVAFTVWTKAGRVLSLTATIRV